MKAIDLETMQAAHKAICGGTAVGSVITAEWLAGFMGVTVAELPTNKKGDPEHVNLSQIWRYHTRQYVIGKATCDHCKAELGGKDTTDLAPIADDVVAATKAVGAAIKAGQSWGLISVRLGNNGMANAPWAESRVRKVYSGATGIQSRGLRPTHSGGRWVADCMELYREEHAVGTMEDGVETTSADSLNALIEQAKGTHKERTPEQYEAVAKERALRKKAHEASIRKLLAERKAASK